MVFDKQADVIDGFNTTSRYLDDILNINNVFFDNMVSKICPSELQLNKANTSDTEAAFLDLHLSISNDIVCTKIYDKRDDFDFEIFNFSFLDGDVPRSTSYGVYISQLIIPTLFLKKRRGYCYRLRPSVCPSVCPSVMLSPPKPLEEIQPSLVCELLT